MFWNYYVLKLLRLETITFSDAMLSDINVVLCYVLSQYLQISSIDNTYTQIYVLSAVGNFLLYNKCMYGVEREYFFYEGTYPHIDPSLN
jgi:hypothetical protein